MIKVTQVKHLLCKSDNPNKRKIQHLMTLEFHINGAARENRTPDLLITRQLLYRLSYDGKWENYDILSQTQFQLLIINLERTFQIFDYS